MNAISPRPRLVVVGNGMAGIRIVEEILDRAPAAFRITVFGAEPHGNYNRIMLSPVLAGEKRFEEIVTHDRGWYDANDIELIAGERVARIDRARRAAIGTNGTERRYDVLLLATGSNPLRLPLPGADLPGVIGFRDIADVEAMLATCRTGKRAVVIGGGLLELEAAHGLARNGMAVSVVHLMSTLMERQLDPESG
jgi:nitrite reductase (NADH) large subunit